MKATYLVLMISVAVLAFSACDTDDGNGGSGKFPSREGKITVTNLPDNFNGKYAFATGLAGGKVLTGLTDISGYPSNISFKLVEISNNRAEIPLYTPNIEASSYSTSYKAYYGNDSVTTLSIYILNEGSLKESNVQSLIMSNLGHKTVSSGYFSNGNISVKWVWSHLIYTAEPLMMYQWNNVSLLEDKCFYFIADESEYYLHKIIPSSYSVSLMDDEGNHLGHGISYVIPGFSLTNKYAVTPGEKYYIYCQYNNPGILPCKVALNTSVIPPALP
jgi:hypothetical protein